MAGYFQSEQQTRASALELALKTIQTLADGGMNVSGDRAADIDQLHVNASDVSVLGASRESGGGGAADLTLGMSADDIATLERRQARAALIASMES